MRGDNRSDEMRKWILIIILLAFGIVISACNSDDEKVGKAESENENVFSNADLEKSSEMINFLNEKMKEFEVSTNKAIENDEIKVGNNDALIEEVQKLAQQNVIQPFLEKYPNSMVSRNDDDNFIPITIEPSSSESCSLGNCTYEKINVLEIDFDVKKEEQYFSENFNATQLIFDSVSVISEIEDEKEEGELRFMKTTEGELVITSIPNVQLQTLYLDEIDEEYSSIETDVPESEIEAEQADYKEEVEETLAKFPELQ